MRAEATACEVELMSEDGIKGLLSLFAFSMGAALVYIILRVILRNAPLPKRAIAVGLLLVLITCVIILGFIVAFWRARKQQEDDYSGAEPLRVSLRQMRAREKVSSHANNSCQSSL